MRPRNELLSIGLSAAIALMLIAQFMPRTEISKAPEKSPMMPPAAMTKPQITVTAITLPPPPEPNAEAPTLPEVSAQAINPLTPSAPATSQHQPAAVKPLRAVSSAEAEPIKPIPVEPLKSNPNLPSKPEESVALPVAKADVRMARSVEPMKTKNRTDAADHMPEATSEPVDALSSEPVIGREEAKPLMAQGRPLLRLLEHGDGPQIDIAWPEGSGAREQLFRSFARCYGMVVALMGPQGNLYSDQSETAPWPINLDRFSGFVRQSGRLGTSGERAWSLRILRRHPAAAGAATVRVFPRAMDALLIGGLRKLLGDNYRSAKSIDARYVQRGGAVIIVDILANGLPVKGRIDLTHAAGRECRGRRAKGV